MKALHEVTRLVKFTVLADGVKDAERIAAEVCPINEFPPGAIIDTRAYLTPNQSEELKRRAINYGE
ncbi:hypothetical protein [Duganella vulcania]|uniref:Uncharacterized protein n=1 Tax=Duganella vulcania TaxID=2692166 RepID=A0A845GE59_9BURK|nr:hypothetical protein [Duganella vulcania]MYM92574.1 hypothetical protein [Duganella vulcania]